ncbi:HAMP domain-containing histidine kinase [Desulfotomaculum nigrificans]|uniref:HAMP domain-containing histidine kinase n=1 Tax=Desulfotomaculum nigrificans TaxID=1565 RepID=UPI0001FAE772
MLVLGVFSFSVIIQAQQIKTFFYDQQARFYVYEAEEVASFFKKDAKPEVIKERIWLLSQFLGADILVVNESGDSLFHQQYGNRPKYEHKVDRGLLEKAKAGRNTVFTGKIAGVNEEVFLASVPLKRDGRIAGAVLIHSPLSTIQQQIKNMLKIAIFGALLGIVMATVLSIFLFRKFTNPLIEMEKTAKAIAEGDFGKQLNVSSDDEVGRLALSLNRMSAQLKEKIDDIERLDRLRQELVSDVSHELRTPLTVIQGFAEALHDGIVKSKEQEKFYLHNIMDEAGRLKDLVNDILKLRSMEVGHMEEMEFVVLNKLVNITVERMKQIASAKKTIVKTITPPEAITVFGNIDRLKQVLTNLVDNAISHSYAGGMVAVELGLREGFAFIAVKDNGPGIPQEELENIWERFYKVDKSRSRRGTGSGLGLSIVRKIVEVHGGKVTVESELGKGATFTVFLPLSET